MKYIISIVLFIGFHSSSAQVLETKNWCLSRCDIAGDERVNTELIYLQMLNDSIFSLEKMENMYRFPLRIGIVQKDTNDVHIKELIVRRAIVQLNTSFSDANFLFYIDKVDVILSDLYLEDLGTEGYQTYNLFSDQYDIEEMISLYIFDHKNEFCSFSATGISCSRTGGFSYIMSNRTNNIVMSRFDLSDRKVLAHEFGHFFGLYHTFEQAQFGRDLFDLSQCDMVCDHICDTPPDPGANFEVYVNYSNCEMNGLKNEFGSEYKPLIQNFMSYYKPCYLRRYNFTEGQIKVMRYSALQDMRYKFTR